MEPLRHVGYHVDLRKSSRNPHTSRAREERFPSPKASRGLRLRDQFKSEKPTSHLYSYEVKQNLSSGPFLTPKSSWSYQKLSLEKKVLKDDELVKHMSNLPCYLQRVERGENVQEKVLNFGVLDWDRLEKWKYNQKQVSGSFSMSSPASSNTSSLFSTVESSNLSSGSESGNLTRGKQSPSLKSHMTVTSKGRHSKGMKPSGENGGPHQDSKTVPKMATEGIQKIHRTNNSCRNNYLEIKFEKSKGKDLDPKGNLGMGNISCTSKNNASFGPKGKPRGQEGALTQRTEHFQELILPNQHPVGEDNNIVLLLPRTSSKKILSGISQHVEMKASNNGSQREATARGFSNGFCVSEELHFSKVHSEIPHSCPQPSTSKHSDMRLTSPIVAHSLKVPSVGSHFSLHSNEMVTVPSLDKQAGETKLTRKAPSRRVVEPSSGSALKVVEPPLAKGRCQSPNPRLSSSLTKISRSFSSNRGSALPQLSSSYISVKSGPVASDACLGSSSRDKSTINGKSRSSPLRRLLDPLLKSKSANHLNLAEPPNNDSTVIRDVCESLGGSLASSIEPEKRNVDFSTTTPTKNTGIHLDGKQMVPEVQALLQVSVKNGLPWFTFAVDNNSDILAATMRKVSATGKYDCSWIYTFYTFHKTKKNSGGWISQGSKSKSHDYVPGIVGHMKVAGSQKLTGIDSMDQVMVREFVLFGVETEQTDKEALDFQQNNELAAIVIKVPKVTRERSIACAGYQSSNYKDMSRMGKDMSRMGLPESTSKKLCCKSHDNLDSDPNGGNQNHTNVVVILPNGVHSLPVKGLPSSLVDRWRSGGSCDCGGWDVGCQLRVISNQDQCSRTLCSTKVYSSQEKFDLYAQGGGAQEKCPYFSLVTYSKGVHSIDFSATMSRLQAFSICIAFLHSKNLAKVSNMFEEMKQDPISVEAGSVKVPCQIERKAPRCTTFPPRSPVGRV